MYHFYIVKDTLNFVGFKKHITAFFKQTKELYKYFLTCCPKFIDDFDERRRFPLPAQQQAPVGSFTARFIVVKRFRYYHLFNRIQHLSWSSALIEIFKHFNFTLYCLVSFFFSFKSFLRWHFPHTERSEVTSILLKESLDLNPNEITSSIKWIFVLELDI